MARRRKPGSLPRMIVDYSKCIRVEDGDEEWAKPSVPYTCPSCLTEGLLSGRLRFGESAVPLCEDHDPPVQMQEVSR